MPTPTLRGVSRDDAHTVAQHRYPDLPAEHDALATYAAWLEDALTRGVYLGWVYDLEGQIVAGVGLTLLEWGPTRDDPNAVCARLVNLYTVPKHRRRGLARALVARALEEAEARGIHTVRLSTTDAARGLSRQEFAR